MDQVKNFAHAILSVGINDSVTTCLLTSGTGALLPVATASPAVGFYAVIWNITLYSDASKDPNREIVRVTARSGDTITTMTRGALGAGAVTGAKSHNLAGSTYRFDAVLADATWNNQLQSDILASQFQAITDAGLNTLQSIRDMVKADRTALQAVATPADGTPFFITGLDAAYDGRGGLFMWDAADTTTPDDDTFIQITATATGRMKRVF